MLAMRGTWRGAGLPRQARVEAIEEGWLWGSPMPDDSYSVIACVESQADYFALLRRSALFCDLRGATTVHTCDATTYAADIVCDDRLLRVGDASHSLDPLSSSGVHSAMQAALHASIVINTILRRPGRAAAALRFYADAQRAAVAEHAAWTRRFYAESRWRDAPFWRKRGNPATMQPGNPATCDSNANVMLSPGASINDVPCVIGDFVELRPGVAGPALPRPFVWIGGVPAAPLLRPIERAPMRRNALLASWSKMTPGREAAVFDALWHAGVLVAAG
jgi:hypothetical protein